MTTIVERNLPSGVWEDLLPHALSIIEDIKSHGTPDPFWTFGGGTVLMFRYQHRLSKDIDIFVPDPQYLGFVTPRLSDVAAAVSTDYVEDQSSYVKLIRPEGEIDFVASPNLTEAPFEMWNIGGQHIRVETAAEIVAKKLWHRGDRATARDLFDLSLVIEREPEALIKAAKFLRKNADLFTSQIASRASVLKAQFAEIDVLNYKPSYDDAAQRASQFLSSLR
ncbi:nucleotidyl transferase AbiEii/AbiGii toxin family protein [Polynucleobacter sphagniphilus]|jgi:predicted nucleotidyltransferase component of viral defense system|uniref:nucleotidyl transferase AbiEii/AbiGii toxin family protein n=1 Tax=Polynucleobacter sphagniphilus TaxID=1743169 RepID=UPI0024748320|nr:nucleotidyl transferase AbiEii/AbiGii toxin family protein [Polynucleobacter sphagniphilus]MDH6301034.1 putative nucleotidyltransferase component of viral defense system [Polynucleobacter sphagniphilus]